MTNKSRSTLQMGNSLEQVILYVSKAVFKKTLLKMLNFM